MRQFTWNQVRERFYRNHEPLPRDKWRATNPNARVAVDLEPREAPEDACPDCQGKGWLWKAARPGKGVAQVLTKCGLCNGTGEGNAKTKETNAHAHDVETHEEGR